MEKIYQITLSVLAAFLVLSSCQDESDLVLDRAASPVLLVTDPISENSEIKATFYELDKTGILDHTVGIDSIPIPNLSIEVLSSSSPIGTFTTDADGSFVVQDLGSLVWVGEYKGVKFRFQ